MYILGISWTIHESSACLLRDGELVFAIAEERLSRKKQDGRFPIRAIRAALDFAGISADDLEHVAVGWPKPAVMFRHDIKAMLTGAMPSSLQRWERTFMEFIVRGMRHKGGELDYRRAFGRPQRRLHFINHHLAHALSAYLLSEFDTSSILVVDGRGAREATTLWHAVGNEIRLLEQYNFPNSLGVFYAGITAMLGFVPFSDEWKVMGLAAYGKPTVDLSRLIRCRGDRYEVESRRFFGKTDQDYRPLEELLGPRRNGEDLSSKHEDLACSAQKACEQAMLLLVRRLTTMTGCRNLCLAGGVALNSKANGELLRSGLIDDIYIQPAAGDDGSAIGAAYAVYARLGLALPRKPIRHTCLGPSYSNDEMEDLLKVYKLPYEKLANAPRRAAELLAADRLVGWFQDRMEFGPRALGARSILADPRNVHNRDRVNAAVKFREGWRPFAPSVLLERGAEYFQDFRPSPYMILTFWANPAKAAEIPAVVHVDGSARVQSVERSVNPRYYQLIEEFDRITGVPVLLNTSFNLKGDPIVCSPKDAIQTFFTSGLDDLVIGDFVVSKSSMDASKRSKSQVATQSEGQG
jgi:carbamoyltransferase